VKKYFQVYKTEFLSFLQYRSEFIAEIIAIFIRVFIVLYLALAVYENKEEIYGYTLSGFATYTLLTSFIFQIIDTDINWVLSHQIRKGDLANYLLKPLKYNWYRLFAELSWKSHSLFYSLLVLTAMTFLYAKTFTLQIVSSRIWVFAVAMILSYLFNRSWRYIIGTLAFWTKDIGGISNFIKEISGFLGGSGLPLEFFGPFTNLLKLLPFSYIFYFPIQIIIDPNLNSFNILKILVIESIWVILLFIIGQILWKKGIKHFESVGI
jgi:ABC-2 type transport system permease protein